MSSESLRETDPLQNIFLDISKILEFMEIKNLEEANNCETQSSKEWAELWINMYEGNDSYLTYRQVWDASMFRDVLPTVTSANIEYFISHPNNVPLMYRDHLLEAGREKFFREFKETNSYYLMLTGQPSVDEKEVIKLSEATRNLLHAPDDPLQDLSPLIQNRFIETDEYQALLEKYPEKKWLRYIGMNKIDLYTARKAKDFEIIRYPSSDRSDINPYLLENFRKLYVDYREYVMASLYNNYMENLYPGYRDFMGLLIISFALLQLPKVSVELANGRQYIDDSMIHIILSMYKIPNTLLMTNEVRRNLVAALPMLVQEKATSTQLYNDLITILGYQNIIVSKLMLMKGQTFDASNNYATSPDNADPYFLKINISDTNPYNTIANGLAPKYSYKEIIDKDPTWWDLADTQKVLTELGYSEADTKYIMLDAIINQMEYMVESIFFLRMILDNQNTTDSDDFTMEIPEIFGTVPVSLYDLMVYILAAMCMNGNLDGTITLAEDRMWATAGFNFDLDYDSLTDFVDSCQYVDKERLMRFMENLSIKTKSDIYRLYNDVIYPLRAWLEQKIAESESRTEYVEYEKIYRALFTYDVTRNSFLDEFELPLETIKNKYGISDEEMKMFQHFYPRTRSGDAVKTSEFSPTNNVSMYRYPFLAKGNVVDWFIDISVDTPYGPDNRGTLYFHDILNSPDIRMLTKENGQRIFMDCEDGVTWKINRQAVNEAIRQIDLLDDDMLNNAFIQVRTPILKSGGAVYEEGDVLPANIRSSLYKTILKDKLTMDLDGLAVQPDTYKEYLRRKNEKLYELLVGEDGDRFEKDKEGWMNDLYRVVLAVETELDIHMKYFEQAVVGQDLFFKPLITLIKRFKSSMVDFIKAGVSYVFGDKIDAGGNSNMLKFFDEISVIIHFVTLAQKGYNSQFGLFDAEHKAKYKVQANDRTRLITSQASGFDDTVYKKKLYGFRIQDEAKFMKNGKPVDPDGQPSYWIAGDPNSGTHEDDEEFSSRGYATSSKITNSPIDLEGWKEFR